MARSDPEREREYQRQYIAEHREKVRTRQREWRRQNAQRINGRIRAVKDALRSEGRCVTCGAVLSETEGR